MMTCTSLSDFLINKVPVNVMEDRLFGSVDVKKTLELGETVFTPGSIFISFSFFFCLLFL